MPTKSESMEFVRQFKADLRAAGLTNPSGMAVGELNKAIDKAAAKVGGRVNITWGKLKLKGDASPDEQAAVEKKIKRKQMVAGTYGGSAPVPDRPTLKKDTGKGAPPAKKGPGRPTKSAGGASPKKKAESPKTKGPDIDDEIAALHAASDKIEAGKTKTIAQYRKQPIKAHNLAQRKAYVSEMQKRYKQFTAGRDVLINHMGENKIAKITKNMTPGNSSIEVDFLGKVQRKDLATVYGFADRTAQKGPGSMPKPKGGNIPMGKKFSNPYAYHKKFKASSLDDLMSSRAHLLNPKEWQMEYDRLMANVGKKKK